MRVEVKLGMIKGKPPAIVLETVSDGIMVKTVLSPEEAVAVINQLTAALNQAADKAKSQLALPPQGLVVPK